MFQARSHKGQKVLLYLMSTNSEIEMQDCLRVSKQEMNSLYVTLNEVYFPH